MSDDYSLWPSENLRRRWPCVRMNFPGEKKWEYAEDMRLVREAYVLRVSRLTRGFGVPGEGQDEGSGVVAKGMRER
jgi:hypothetical protein